MIKNSSEIKMKTKLMRDKQGFVFQIGCATTNTKGEDGASLTVCRKVRRD